MADEQQQDTEQAQDAPETPAQPANDTEQAGTSITDVEALQKELNKARQESAKYRNQRNEYKTDAEKYREFQESQKSDLEKITEQNAALEQELQQMRADKVRTDISLKYGLSSEDDVLLGTGDEETLTARAEKIAELRKAAAAAVQAPPSDIPNPTLKGGDGGTADEPVDDAYPSGWVI